MKSKLFLFVVLFHCFVCFAQRELAKNGTITLANNQKIAFNNLRLADGKFIFVDIESATEKQLSLNEVKYVDDDKMSRVFTNKSVETIDEAKKIEEARQLAIKQKEAQEMEERLRIMREEATSLHLVPNGIYKTKEDFINKRVSSSIKVVPKALYGYNRPVLTQIVDNCFFYYDNSDEKVKDAFAICYKGHLYFRINAILENRNKTDRAQSNNSPNSFVRVISAGDHYYYLEANLTNQWAQAALYGGVFESSVLYTKGIVWDIKNQEFNIFKNCSDFNDFIRDKYPEGLQECKKQQADIVQVRSAIEKIK